MKSNITDKELRSAIDKLRLHNPFKKGFVCVMNGKQLREVRKNAGLDYECIDENSVYTWNDREILSVEKIGDNKL